MMQVDVLVHIIQYYIYGQTRQSEYSYRKIAF